MINKSVVELEYKIMNVINEAKMPPAVVSLVLNKLIRNVDELTMQMVNKEMQDAQKEQEKTEENE